MPFAYVEFMPITSVVFMLVFTVVWRVNHSNLVNAVTALVSVFMAAYGSFLSWTLGENSSMADMAIGLLHVVNLSSLLWFGYAFLVSFKQKNYVVALLNIFYSLSLILHSFFWEVLMSI
ncbi:hypothetical protein ACVFI8_16645 [Agarivorans sp. MS3-6]|uniref:hypothetical protein n=1 Tax=Agarivorans sp. TSD2052 TaxID=2937286 RepID=UPI00200EA2C8|nr:hypothetical protein [Agarivorans sp. TSD2052]UPW17096.1 hypothetical protein M0C34_12640 [Agarivorans sp. TSD2052]